jgi:hypothetical protein
MESASWRMRWGSREDTVDHVIDFVDGEVRRKIVAR